MMNHYTEIYESKSTLPLIALPFQNISKVKVSDNNLNFSELGKLYSVFNNRQREISFTEIKDL
jgi:hypothetical protein